MKMREALWSAAACCRFPRASLLAQIRHYLRSTAGKPACKKRQQAAALQSASGARISMAAEGLQLAS